MLGLNPNVRKNGGTGGVWGVDTPESYIIEKVANAKNAFREKGTGKVLNTEQISSGTAETMEAQRTGIVGKPMKARIRRSTAGIRTRGVSL